MTAINPALLPEGRHWGLHIEHRLVIGGDAGTFTGGGWKLMPHITVSPWGAIDQMVNVLVAKHACPHVIIGGRKGTKLPVVIQLLPFDVAARALKNDPTDGFQTNRANVVQVEICADVGAAKSAVGQVARLHERADNSCTLFQVPAEELTEIAYANIGAYSQRAIQRDAIDGLCMREAHGVAAARVFNTGVAAWTDETYKALANLFELIRHRVKGIPNKCPRSFKNTKRFTDSGFVKTSGYVGHMHAPDNDHIDPTTAFNGAKLVRFVRSAPNEL